MKQDENPTLTQAGNTFSHLYELYDDYDIESDRAEKITILKHTHIASCKLALLETELNSMHGNKFNN